MCVCVCVSYELSTINKKTKKKEKKEASKQRVIKRIEKKKKTKKYKVKYYTRKRNSYSTNVAGRYRRRYPKYDNTRRSPRSLSTFLRRSFED